MVFFWVVVVGVEVDGLGGGFGLLCYVGDEVVVEIFCGVVVYFFEGLGECGDFDEVGYVVVGVDIEDDVWDFLFEDVVEIFF